MWCEVDDIFYKHRWDCCGLKQDPAVNALYHWRLIFKLSCRVPGGGAEHE